MQRQRILFSAYRTDQYSDPEGYMASLGMVLEGYSDDVIKYVTDPKTGIQRKSKWPPTISEIVEACDQHQDYLAKCERLRNWGNQPKMIEPPREDRPSLEELKAKHGENWGLKSLNERPIESKPAPSWDEITAIYQADPTRLARLVPVEDAET